MNADQFRQWRFERAMIDDLLARVEQVERAILEKLRCPTDPVAVFAILNGEQRAPWPARTAARDKKRALHAMHTLVHLSATRRHLGLQQDNARLAAHAALLAGLYAGDSAINAVLAAQEREKSRKGGHQRGKQIKTAAKKRHKAIDNTIVKYDKRWCMSDELQEQFPQKVKYIREQTGYSRATVYRRLKALSQ